MTVKDGIEIAMLLIMGGGLFVVHSNRRMLRRGIGVRVIQFLAVAFLLPAIVILSLEGKLGNESTGTLLGDRNRHQAIASLWRSQEDKAYKHVFPTCDACPP